MQTVASRRMRKPVIWLVVVYEAIFLATFYAVHRFHPSGAVLMVLAALPVLPTAGMFALFGRYLRDETDGYKRELAIRCVLWGTAGFLVVDYFLNILRLFDWKGQAPPFCELGVFLILALIAKFSYRAANRVPVDA